MVVLVVYFVEDGDHNCKQQPISYLTVKTLIIFKMINSHLMNKLSIFEQPWLLGQF